MLQRPSVHEASVVGRPDPEWGEVVVAFAVTKAGATVHPAALDRHCVEHIAGFKRPKAYYALESLPKNNYGKVPKTELRELLARGAAPVPARTK